MALGNEYLMLVCYHQYSCQLWVSLIQTSKYNKHQKMLHFVYIYTDDNLPGIADVFISPAMTCGHINALP